MAVNLLFRWKELKLLKIMNNKKIKKILIFGKGQLGQELWYLLKSEYEIEILDHSRIDITNKEGLFKIVRKRKPHCIINVAAFTHVEQAEFEMEKAFQANAFGSFYLASAAKEVKSLFIHISSDYVFDGRKKSFVETDTTNPLNVYGASKLAGEILIKIVRPDYYIFRTSAVFGLYSSKNRANFVDQMIKLAQSGKDLTVVKDQLTSPTYAADLASKIMEFIQKQPPRGIYHITNSGSCSWYEFTVKIMEIMNLNAKVKPITTKNTLSRISRPRNSILRNQLLKTRRLGILPSWENALKRYCRSKYGIKAVNSKSIT